MRRRHQLVILNRPSSNCIAWSLVFNLECYVIPIGQQFLYLFPSPSYGRWQRAFGALHYIASHHREGVFTASGWLTPLIFRCPLVLLAFVCFIAFTSFANDTRRFSVNNTTSCFQHVIPPNSSGRGFFSPFSLEMLNSSFLPCFFLLFPLFPFLPSFAPT